MGWSCVHWLKSVVVIFLSLDIQLEGKETRSCKDFDNFFNIKPIVLYFVMKSNCGCADTVQ